MRGIRWSGRRDLNPGPLAPQASALARLRHGPNRRVEALKRLLQCSIDAGPMTGVLPGLRGDEDFRSCRCSRMLPQRFCCRQPLRGPADRSESFERGTSEACSPNTATSQGAVPSKMADSSRGRAWERQLPRSRRAQLGCSPRASARGSPLGGSRRGMGGMQPSREREGKPVGRARRAKVGNRPLSWPFGGQPVTAAGRVRRRRCRRRFPPPRGRG